MLFDLLIRNGTIVDGTGAPPTSGDVGVISGRIAAVGQLTDANAEIVIDATRRVVAPGFIDAHSHLDAVTRRPGSDVHRSSVRQGVTTEVTGNCGFSPFPVSAAHEAAVRRDMVAVGPDAATPTASLAAWREQVASDPPAVNIAPLLGHGSLRAAAMAFDDRAPTAAELDLMLRLAEQAMDEGAFGISSGLIYTPGVYAMADELVAVATTAGRRGRPYATHMRDEGDAVLEAVEEALTIGRAACAPVQISHHKIAGRHNWGRSAATLGRIAAARAAGEDVWLDVYPYTAASTGLTALLPPWVNAGGVEALRERLTDPASRDRIARDVRDGLPGWQNPAAIAGWDAIVLGDVPGAPEVAHRSIHEVARERGQPEVDVLADLLLASGGGGGIVVHAMDAEEVHTILEQPFALAGSDGMEISGPQHPRVAGSFVRTLRLQLDRRGQGALPDIIRRMTGVTAQRFAIPDRGVTRQGMVADLVVFDPATVEDRATYADPWAPPVGIDHVVVAGQLVVRDGQDTGLCHGVVPEPAS